MLSKSEFKGLFDEHLNEEGKEKLWEVYEGLETRGVLLTSACVCRDQSGNVFTVYRCSSDTWSDGCDFYDEHGEPDSTDSAPIVEIIKTLTDQEILEFQIGTVSVDTTFQVGDWVSIQAPAEGEDLEDDPFVPGMEEQFDMVGQVTDIDGDVTLKVKVEGQSKEFWWDPAYLSKAPVPLFRVGDWVSIHAPDAAQEDIESDSFVDGMEGYYGKVGQVVEFDHDGYYTVMTNEDDDRHYIWHPAYLSPAPEPTSVVGGETVPQFKPGDKVWLVDKGPTEHSYYGWISSMDSAIMDRLTVDHVSRDGSIRLLEISYAYHPDSFIKAHPEAGDWDKGIAESAYDHGLIYLGTLTKSDYWTHDEDLFVYTDGDWELTTDLREPNKHYAYQEKP